MNWGVSHKLVGPGGYRLGTVSTRFLTRTRDHVRAGEPATILSDGPRRSAHIDADLEQQPLRHPAYSERRRRTRLGPPRVGPRRRPARRDRRRSRRLCCRPRRRARGGLGRARHPDTPTRARPCRRSLPDRASAARSESCCIPWRRPPAVPSRIPPRSSPSRARLPDRVVRRRCRTAARWRSASRTRAGTRRRPASRPIGRSGEAFAVPAPMTSTSVCIDHLERNARPAPGSASLRLSIRSSDASRRRC